MNALRDENLQICNYKGWVQGASVTTIWLLLTEEMGELASAIRQRHGLYKKNKASSVEDELGDVFSYLFQLASMLDIDLDNMWRLHKIKMIRKIYNG